MGAVWGNFQKNFFFIVFTDNTIAYKKIIRIRKVKCIEYLAAARQIPRSAKKTRTDRRSP